MVHGQRTLKSEVPASASGALGLGESLRDPKVGLVPVCSRCPHADSAHATTTLSYLATSSVSVTDRTVRGPRSPASGGWTQAYRRGPSTHRLRGAGRLRDRSCSIDPYIPARCIAADFDDTMNRSGCRSEYASTLRRYIWKYSGSENPRAQSRSNTVRQVLACLPDGRVYTMHAAKQTSWRR